MSNRKMGYSAALWTFLLLLLAILAELPYSLFHIFHTINSDNGVFNYLNLIIHSILYLFTKLEHLLLFSTIVIAAIINEIIVEKYKMPFDVFKSAFLFIPKFIVSLFKFRGIRIKIIRYFEEIKSVYLSKHLKNNPDNIIIGFVTSLIGNILILIVVLQDWFFTKLQNKKNVLNTLSVIYLTICFLYLSVKCEFNDCPNNRIGIFSQSNNLILVYLIKNIDNLTYALFLVSIGLTFQFRFAIEREKRELI